MDLSPLWISLKIAVMATVITFFAGIMAAFAVSHMKRGRAVVDSIMSIPLVLPPTVVGFLLLILMGRNSFLGRFLNSVGINVIFTVAGGVIASAIVSFPIMYRSTRGAIDQVDTNLINVARTLGMSEWEIFRKVLIPNAWPGIAAATVLSFARALGEFGATIMVAGNIPGKTRTMSVAIYSFMQSGNREKAYLWVGLIIMFSMVVLVLMNVFTDGFKRRKR
ncbi:MAG: molybdate ABC transporter permease subunit [Lachnospiraceae bacterium]|nr:molybdate ABC transporter permease subunit [Lachnospiraceae bacterium]